jgi:hypothetical protein
MIKRQVNKMYNAVKKKDLEYFKSFLDEKNVLVGNDIKIEYTKDELGTVEETPEVVLKY